MFKRLFRGAKQSPAARTPRAYCSIGNNDYSREEFDREIADPMRAALRDFSAATKRTKRLIQMADAGKQPAPADVVELDLLACAAKEMIGKLSGFQAGAFFPTDRAEAAFDALVDEVTDSGEELAGTVMELKEAARTAR